MKKRCVMSTLVALMFLLSVAVPVFADNDFNDYVTAPPGTKVIGVYYNHLSGNKAYADGDKVGDDTNLKGNIGIFRPIYFTQFGPFTIDPQVLIPFGELSLDGKDVGGVEISTSGFSDPILAATLWLMNDCESKTWLGITPFVTIPLGEYDHDRALNMGANRWAFKGEVGFVKGFGELYLNLTANAEFYTDNDDFGAAKDTMEQDPIYTLESHLGYNLSKSFLVSLDYFYHEGGETTVAGTEMHDKQDNHAAQITLGFMLSPTFQLLVKYKQDLEVENGIETDTFGIRLLHFF
jgi:hypothetical protein